MQAREKQIRQLHEQYADFYRLLGSLAVFIGGILLGGVLFSVDRLAYAQDVFTDILVMSMGVIVLSEILRRREINTKKRELLSRLRSHQPYNATEAMREIRDNNLFHLVQAQKDNLYKLHWNKIDLSQVDLEGANLESTSLESASLYSANLEGAKLRSANMYRFNGYYAVLRGASLGYADLREATLHRTNLEKAFLWGADLEDANLQSANLCGANLMLANLKHADLKYAKFDERTILPDSNIVVTSPEARILTHDDYDKYWTPDTDMTRYTDPNHPDFWETSSLPTKNNESD